VQGQLDDAGDDELGHQLRRKFARTQSALENPEEASFYNMSSTLGAKFDP
jgi:hypothetical protein